MKGQRRKKTENTRRLEETEGFPRGRGRVSAGKKSPRKKHGRRGENIGVEKEKRVERSKRERILSYLSPQVPMGVTEGGLERNTQSGGGLARGGKGVTLKKA